MTTATTTTATAATAATVNVGEFRAAVKNIAAATNPKTSTASQEMTLTVNNATLTVAHDGIDFHASVMLPADNATNGTMRVTARDFNKTLTNLLGSNTKAVNNATLPLSVRDDEIATCFDGMNLSIPQHEHDSDADGICITSKAEHVATLATVTAADLHTAYKRLNHAVSTDDTLPMLCGINLTLHHGELVFHATDRFRAAEQSVDATVEDAASEHETHLISADAYKHLVALLPNDDTEVTISLVNVPGMGAKQGVRFDTRNTTVIARHIDGDFPNIYPLWPATARHMFTVDRKTLETAAKKLDKLAGRNPRIMFYSSGHRVELATETDSKGRASTHLESTLAAVDETESITFGLAADFLLQLVKAFDCERMAVALTAPHRPVVFFDADHNVAMLEDGELDLRSAPVDHREILMPHRLPA